VFFLNNFIDNCRSISKLLVIGIYEVKGDLGESKEPTFMFPFAQTDSSPCFPVLLLVLSAFHVELIYYTVELL